MNVNVGEFGKAVTALRQRTALRLKSPLPQPTSAKVFLSREPEGNHRLIDSRADTHCASVIPREKRAQFSPKANRGSLDSSIAIK